MPSSQIRAVLKIIKDAGGKISAYDLLDALGHDPTLPNSNNILNKILYRARRDLVQYDGSDITIRPDKLDTEEVQIIIQDLVEGLNKKEKFYDRNYFLWGLALGLVVGFIITFLLSLFFFRKEVIIDENIVELDCDNMLELLTPLLNAKD